MKTKIAAALSIVGVLGAGSAAALVNTQILDNGPTASGASAAVLPPASSIELTVPTTTLASMLDTSNDPRSTPEPAASTTSSSVVPAAAVAPAASGMLTAFNVGEAGVVTVDVIDGRLLLVSAEPKSGWTLTKAEDDSNDDSDEVEDEVEVEFASSSVQVEFEAHLVDGQIVPKVESRSIGGTSSAATSNTMPSNTVPSDTIDDDDYEDDFDDDSEDDSDDRDEDSDDDRDEGSDDARDEDSNDDRDDDSDDDRDDD